MLLKSEWKDQGIRKENQQPDQIHTEIKSLTKMASQEEVGDT